MNSRSSPQPSPAPVVDGPVPLDTPTGGNTLTAAGIVLGAIVVALLLAWVLHRIGRGP